MSASGSLKGNATGRFSLFSSSSRQLSLIDVQSTIVEDERAQRAISLPGSIRSLTHVPTRAVALRNGLALASSPLAMLDLSAGCCRGPGGKTPAKFKSMKNGPAPIQALPWLSRKAVHVGEKQALWVAKNDVRKLAFEAVNRTEHAWLYLCMHSHGSTYYHGLAEAAPRLLFGLRLLRAHSEIRVLTSAATVVQVLKILGIDSRVALFYDGRPTFARQLTIPPGAATIGGLTARGAQAELMVRALRKEIARRPAAQRAGSGSVMVIRRAAAARRNARTMLNHDELMATLRKVLAQGGQRLVEWPPDADVAMAAAGFGAARMLIAPHGAGTTNVIFMPPGSTVVEILGEGQRGRVYGSLSKAMGHNYVPCIFNRSQPAFRSSVGWYTQSLDNFVLDIPWLMRCIKRAINHTRGTPASPWSEQAWSNVDEMLRGDTCEGQDGARMCNGDERRGPPARRSTVAAPFARAKKKGAKG